MPSIFEISNSGMCNRKCAFCPRSDPNYKHVNEFISQSNIKPFFKGTLETPKYTRYMIIGKKQIG